MGSGLLKSFCTLPRCPGAVGSGTPIAPCLTALGSGQWNSCSLNNGAPPPWWGIGGGGGAVKAVPIVPCSFNVCRQPLSSGAVWGGAGQGRAVWRGGLRCSAVGGGAAVRCGVWCGVVWCGVGWCGVGAVWCCPLPCCAVPCHAVWCGAYDLSNALVRAFVLQNRTTP